MIAIADYGVGNLFSLASSLKYLGLDPLVTQNPAEVLLADGVILPGVGAFGDAKLKLDKTGLVPALRQVVADGRPFLGICLGHQLLFDESEEYGLHKGLSLVPGRVEDMYPTLKAQKLKVPHMGWNSLRLAQPSPLFKYVDDGEFVYFVHSFAAVNCKEYVSAYTDYGGEVVAAIQKNNVFGCQFHPEKSGDAGLRILKAFGEEL